MNVDEKTFTLLQNPQAMRLKKQGYIEGRRFTKQPTKEVIDAALEEEEGGLASAMLRAFNGGS
jgi:hypothetical protein